MPIIALDNTIKSKKRRFVNRKRKYLLILGAYYLPARKTIDNFIFICYNDDDIDFTTYSLKGPADKPIKAYASQIRKIHLLHRGNRACPAQDHGG